MATLRQSLRQLAEEFRSKFNGLSYSVDTIPSVQVVEKLLIPLREQAIRQMFIPIENTNKVVRAISMNSFWCFSVKLKKSSTDQPDFGGLKYSYARFPVPPVIQVNGVIDGFVSVASPRQDTQYQRLTGGQEMYMNLVSRGVQNQNKYWWVSDGAICTNDLSVQYIQPRVCPYDPTEWVTWNDKTSAYELAYNPDTDPFLITGNIKGIMEDMFRQRYMNPISPIDTSQNKTPLFNEQQSR
jgi:hypothetical protein